ncbi:hypothetical protein ACWGN5_26765 [Streptomyces sp. NPDC055815]
MNWCSQAKVPSTTHHTLPDHPTPSPRDLQPYLRGWSADEPKRR